MRASEIDPLKWTLIHHFGKEEFLGWKDRWEDLVSPPAALSMLPYLEAEVVFALEALREKLGKPLLVSRAVGAIARTWSQGSQHHVRLKQGLQRILSHACDLWVPDSTLQEVYAAAKDVPAIGAFGAYPQWETYPGVHVDIRPRKWPGGNLALWMASYQGTGKGRTQVYGALDWARVDKMISARKK